ncbi:MAG: transaldolase family protein, partial [bacterium]|nr:transaldolase family protein [bacterium]
EAKAKALDTITAVTEFIEKSGAGTQIIVGSIREAEDVGDAFRAGAQIVTITPKVLEQMVFNKRTQETIEEFNQAWEKLQTLKKSKDGDDENFSITLSKVK